MRAFIIAVGVYLLLTATLTGLANANPGGEKTPWYTSAARWACGVHDSQDAPSRWCWVPFGEVNGGSPEKAD
jgi:hypothetical protein